MSETALLKLSADEAAEYALCKQVLEDGVAVCYVVGIAARKIKERGWFAADGFKSWDDFIDKQYGWTKRYVNQIIVDAAAINSLPESMRKLVTSHAAARELANVPEVFRAAVLDVASDGGKKAPTAAQIKKAAPAPAKVPARRQPAAPAKRPANSTKPPARRQPAAKPKEKPTLDSTGIEVPAEVKALWIRGQEAQELLTLVSSVKNRLKKAQEAKDPLFVEVDMQAALANLEQVFVDVKRAKPHAVCPTCQGKLAKGCLTCKERGFVSQFYWETFVPIETRNMRDK